MSGIRKGHSSSLPPNPLHGPAFVAGFFSVSFFILVLVLILRQFVLLPSPFLFPFSYIVFVLVLIPILIFFSGLDLNHVFAIAFAIVVLFVVLVTIFIMLGLPTLLSLSLMVLGYYPGVFGEMGWSPRQLAIFLLSLVNPCLAAFSCSLAQRTRALTMIRALEPVRFAQVLLDLVFVVRSRFRDGRRTGPDFVSPMSSLTKRQSGYLAKLLFEYCTKLSKFELDDTNTVHPSAKVRSNVVSGQRVYPQAVVILDLDEVMLGEVPHRRLESQYTTSADVDLMVLVLILLVLLVLLRRGWWFLTYKFIAHSFMVTLDFGPGTLILSRRAATHPTELDPGDGCAVLINDDMTVMIHGSQRTVEAITEGRFYLSFEKPPQTHLRDEDKTETMEELAFLGKALTLLELGLFILGSMLTIDPGFAAIFGRTALVVIIGRMIAKASLQCPRTPTNCSLPPLAEENPLQSAARVTVMFLALLSVAALLFLASPTMILLYGVSFLVQADYPDLFGKLVSQSHYPIRTDQLLDALDHPPIRKWPFLTRASAATFTCLVLCRDIPRPVKNIDVLGVLDTLIPNQRDIWRVWKERVADRIIHEECVNFAPTVPTFPDERQERLKRLLDEAQIGYDTYSSLPPRQGKRA